MLRLSVLDQSVALAGATHGDAIQETLALAGHCERLGYHRFWLSEHHNHDTIVGTAPEILMGAIAARTTRIRIGSAGVMLPHYAPLKVAEQFRVLEALGPGRIDLGVGRAPGSDGRTAFALHPDAASRAERFPEHVRDLAAWVRGDILPQGHPFRSIRAFPTGASAPEIWMLGSSDYGAQLAALFGMPYAFAHFITDGRGTAEALRIYRENYRPSERHPQAQATICLWALAAETDAEAQRLFTSRAHWRIARDRGVLLPIHPPEAPPAIAIGPAEEARIAELRRTAFVGTPDAVGCRIRSLAAELDIDEVVVLTWAHPAAARWRSYELLAREFDLAG